MPIASENFRFIQQFARDSAAIILEPGKEYLVESRLSPLALQAGFPTLDDFISQLRTNPLKTLFHDQVIDALTTNETSFFRDFHPFETLRKQLLPLLIARREPMRKLSIWSGAASTGQEAYSVAMILREHFPELRDWQVSILGTDLSPTVLSQAKEGAYSQLEVNRGLPAPMLLKYFTKVGAKWVVKDDLKKLVEFRQMNLFKPWPILPVFDLVLLRNVMIYFDIETKKEILKRIRNCIHPEGYLFLGAAETTINLDPNWDTLTMGLSTLYQHKAALPMAA